jgi:hypothetical protein
MMKKSLFAVLAFVFALSLVPVFADEDEHYIQPDDYFISKDAFKDQDWVYVFLAKQQEAPKPQTKGEAKFMQVGDGKNVWTKNYWMTRKATKEALKIGTVVIMLDAAGAEDIYRSPESKEEARTANWFIAKITDVSDLYKEYVTVSGGFKVKIDAIRVIVKTPAGK